MDDLKHFLTLFEAEQLPARLTDYELKRARRQWLLKNHPDRNPNSAHKKQYIPVQHAFDHFQNKAESLRVMKEKYRGHLKRASFLDTLVTHGALSRSTGEKAKKASVEALQKGQPGRRARIALKDFLSTADEGRLPSSYGSKITQLRELATADRLEEFEYSRARSESRKPSVRARSRSRTPVASSSRARSRSRTPTSVRGKCRQCHGKTLKKSRCGRVSSCRLGCSAKCFQHATHHVRKQSCRD